MRIHPWRNAAAALVVAVSLASPVSAADAKPNVSVPDTSAIRIDNFGRVDPFLYRGAQPAGRDYSDLKSLGVKTIINLTSDDGELDEKRMTESVGLTYLQIPMSTHTVPTPEQLRKFLATIADPGSQPVFVHCVGGRHRTGVMTAAYRMTHDGWTADEAFKEMKQYRFGADFLHSEFKDFVYGYRGEGIRIADAAGAGTR